MLPLQTVPAGSVARSQPVLMEHLISPHRVWWFFGGLRCMFLLSHCSESHIGVRWRVWGWRCGKEEREEGGKEGRQGGRKGGRERGRKEGGREGRKKEGGRERWEGGREEEREGGRRVGGKKEECWTEGRWEGFSGVLYLGVFCLQDT